jgi:hypothetical protein
VVRVRIDPESFEIVHFGAVQIEDVVRHVAGTLAMDGDEEIQIVVDESSPLARWSILASGSDDEPIVLAVDGGAFEDTRRPREFDPRRTADVLGRMLLRVLDRRTPDFADAPPEDELTLAQGVAWDVYAVGRLARRGHEGQRPRRLYQFRNRHGFSDVADAAFDRIWSADSLTWAELDAISAEARSAPRPDGQP